MDAGAFERLRKVELFDGLSDDDLTRICADVRDVVLEPGQSLFHEGDPGDEAYVIAEGDIEIVKATDRREVLLAVRGPGHVIGEMALLQAEPRIAGARARTHAELVAIPRAALDEVLDASPRAARTVFSTFLTRLKATNDQLKQSERMAQLGTLTAGVAHELNNPAAAVARAAQRLAGELDALADLAATPTTSTVRAAALRSIDPDRQGSLDALERSDAEADVEDWLGARGVDAPWELSAGLVDAGVGVHDLDGLAGEASGEDLADAFRLLVATTAVRSAAREIGEGVGRISTIVRSLKSYAYLDQSPVQDVDVHQGLEDTLVLLAHKTRHVRVVRDYADDLPTITALGTELNQVWTNLIDNACDALEQVGDRIPTVTLRTRSADGTIVVEVEDNGPGIPEEHQAEVFDAFFTTKPPGKGTGLGLQISYRIVVLEHRGDLTISSEPGRTTFRVTLPIEPPEPATTEDTVRDEPCDHLDDISTGPRPEGGCAECLEMGDTWVHLRYCDGCRAVGCCDDSKNRHARAHATASGHPVVRSLEPGEDWAWCFEHRVGVDLRTPT
ncbi:MAG TPA: ATP-binding protein [Nitriliruptorales bacterium]